MAFMDESAMLNRREKRVKTGASTGGIIRPESPNGYAGAGFLAAKTGEISQEGQLRSRQEVDRIPGSNKTETVSEYVIPSSLFLAAGTDTAQSKLESES